MKYFDRVQAHTAECVNQRIQEQAEHRIIEAAIDSKARLSERIRKLDREWDIERWLDMNASGLAFAGLALGLAANRKFLAGDGGAGTWSATDTASTLTFSNGCKPIYKGALSGDRLTASGTMRCTDGSLSGTWRASKTNGILPAAKAAQAQDPALEGPGGLSSGPPD